MPYTATMTKNLESNVFKTALLFESGYAQIVRDWGRLMSFLADAEV